MRRLKKRKPATAQTVIGLSENADHGSPRVNKTNTETSADLQALLVARRFGLPFSLARTIAALAFQTEARA
jgi:hypothetical protein